MGFRGGRVAALALVMILSLPLFALAQNGCVTEVCFGNNTSTPTAPSPPPSVPSTCQLEVCPATNDTASDEQAPYDMHELELDAGNAANESQADPPKDPTAADFDFQHADDERVVPIINVSSLADLVALNPKGNGTAENPWELDHLAIASRDDAAIRIENIGGYLKLDNMTLAGTRGIYAANDGHLTVIDVNMSASVHGIEAESVGVLSVARTNVSAFEFGLWIKKGQGYLDRVNVRGPARDAVVTENWAGKVTFLHLEARRSGFVATNTKGIFQNIIVTKCQQKGITFTGGGDITLIGMAAACGEVGVEVRYARNLDLEGTLVQDADVGLSLQTLVQASVRHVFTARIGVTSIRVEQTPADLAHILLDGGGETGVETIDADVTLNNVTTDGFTKAGLAFHRSSVLAQVFTVRGSPTGMLLDQSELRVALNGGEIAGADVGIDGVRCMLGGVGVVLVHDGGTGARLRRCFPSLGDQPKPPSPPPHVPELLSTAFDQLVFPEPPPPPPPNTTVNATIPFDWAGIDARDLDLALDIDDHADVRMMGLGATDVGQLARVTGGSALHLTRPLSFVRPGGAWNWENVGAYVTMGDRSFLDLDGVGLTLNDAHTFVTSNDSYVSLNASDVRYPASVSPPTTAPAAPPPGQTTTRPPPGAGAGDLTMFKLTHSTMRVNLSTLMGGDVLLDITGMLHPTKGNLSDATFLQMASLGGAHKTGIIGRDTAIYGRTVDVFGNDPTYEYGIHLMGNSVLRLDGVYDDKFGTVLRSVLTGATKEDVLWEPPAAFPLSTISPPRNGDRTHTNVTPLLARSSIGHIRFENFTTDHNVTLLDDWIDRLDLRDSDIKVVDSRLGTHADKYSPDDDQGDGRGLYVNRTKPEKLFAVVNSTITQVVLEKFGAKTFFQDDVIGRMSIRNTTGDGPAVVSSHFNSSAPVLDIMTGSARIVGNVFGSESSLGGPPFVAFDAPPVLIVDRATSGIVLAQNKFPDRATLLWNYTSGTLSRDTFSGPLKVIGTGSETVTISDSTFVDHGFLNWTTTKGFVAYNNFSRARGSGGEIIVNGGVATPVIAGNDFNLSGSTAGIRLDDASLAQYEGGVSRINGNHFFGYGTVVSSQHGTYTGNAADGSPLRTHTDSKGANIAGNLFEGGLYVACHRFSEPYSVPDGNGGFTTAYRYVVDGQFACTGTDTPVYPNATLSADTHTFGGSASGPFGPRAAPAVDNTTPQDPERTGGTQSRSDGPPLPVEDKSGNDAPFEVPCNGFVLIRLRLQLTPLSFRTVAASGTVDLGVAGTPEGKLCDELHDVQVSFVDNGTVVASGTRAQDVFVFSYKPQTGNLTMRATLASKGPNGTQELVLVRNLTGVQTSIGFMPIPNATFLDANQTSRVLDALSKVLSPAEFQALVAAVIAAFAVAGLDFKYDPPKDDKGKPGAPGASGDGGDGPPGSGWNRPTSNYYLAKAGELSGVNETSTWREIANAMLDVASLGALNAIFGGPVFDAEAGSQGKAFAATALWSRDQIVTAFTGMRDQMSGVANMTDEQKLAWIREKRDSVGGRANAAGYLEFHGMDFSGYAARDPILGMATDGSTLINMLKSPWVTDQQVLDALNKGLDKGIPAMDSEIARFQGLDDLSSLSKAVFDPKYVGILKAAAGTDARSLQAVDMGSSVAEGQRASLEADKAIGTWIGMTALAYATLGGSVLVEAGIIEAGSMGSLAVSAIAEGQNLYDAGLILSSGAKVWNAAGDVYGGPSVYAPVLGKAGEDAARANLDASIEELKNDIEGVVKGRLIGAAVHVATPVITGAVTEVAEQVSGNWGSSSLRPGRTPDFSGLRGPSESPGIGVRESEPTPIVKQPEGTLARPRETGAGLEGPPRVGEARGVDIEPARPMTPEEKIVHARDLESAIDRELDLARGERAAREAANAPPPERVQPQGERDAAIASSGMPKDAAEAASRVAQKNDVIMLTQKTNPASTEGIAGGDFTKDMHVKGKSADAGEAASYIPIDQGLGKAGSMKAEHPDMVKYGGREGVVEHYNAEVQKTLDLTADGKPPMLVEIHNADGTARTVQVKYVEMEVPGKVSGEPVKVLGKQFLDPETGAVIKEGPVTADVDMLAIGTKKPQMLQIKDEHMGDLTAGTRDLIKQGNIETGRHDNPLYHHGSAGSVEGMNPGINYPITAYEPNGRVVSIPEGPKGNPDLHLKEYFNEMEGKGYHPDVNKLWGWQREPTTGKWNESAPNLDAKTASGELPPEWKGVDHRPEVPAASHAEVDAHGNPAAPQPSGPTAPPPKMTPLEEDWPGQHQGIPKHDPYTEGAWGRRVEDHRAFFDEEPDATPREDALKAGVPNDALARVEAIAAVHAPNDIGSAANISSTAFDRLRLAQEGHDPYFLHTAAGSEEYARVSQASVHALVGGGLTDADLAFFRGKIAADPQFLDKLPMKGRVLEDGDWLPVASQDVVGTLRTALAAKGVAVPPPVEGVRVSPTPGVRIEDTMPRVVDGKYVAAPVLGAAPVRPPIQIIDPGVPDDAVTVAGVAPPRREMQLE